MINSLPSPNDFAGSIRAHIPSETIAQFLEEEALKNWMHNPLQMIQEIFPWGKPGRLEGESGPDIWQAEILEELGEKSKQQSLGEINEAILLAVKSGHGVGKTALIAWIVIWFMGTRSNPQIVVTANTKIQLETKTWRELAVWHNLSSIHHMFERTATRFSRKSDPETSFAACIPWNKDKPEAFAGTHEENVLIVYDESSDIAETIWETTEGAMTTPGAIWIVFGNPTRNTGRFMDCWGKLSHRWSGKTVDSRTAKKANNEQIQNWIDDYGIDSDFVKVRVLGQFPSASTSQFISMQLVEDAQARNYALTPDVWSWAPVVMGVDVARYGDDDSVIYVRQGLQTHDIKIYHGLDTMLLANYVVDATRQWSPKSIFVDVVGIGSGVVDRLRQLGYDIIIEVNAGAKPISSEFFNLRAETWSKMRAWFGAGGAIPEIAGLKQELISVEYGFDGAGKLQLEKKEDTKKRLGKSPDIADALAFTFAMPIALDFPQTELSQAQKDWKKITNIGADFVINLSM